MKFTMKVLAILTMFGASAVAQSKTRISPEFSKAAVKALVASAHGGKKASDDALVEAESIAASPAEDSVVESLKAFAMLHATMLELDREERKAEMEASGSVVTSSPLSPQLTKDEVCFTAWKASLRRLSAIQPKECK
jgi:hypothetical protein